MKRLINLDINGEVRCVAMKDHHTLLEVLRYELALTGSKQGCDKGDCGACTVLIDGDPILACCSLAAANEGKKIETIEGMGNASGPSKVQRAFDVSGALQCGFCQPGTILSAEALLRDNDSPSDSEIREALAGNLCRCTGYTKIIDAVKLAASGMSQHSERPLEKPTQ
jgi:4-hydroxybenzoyl-CoA reductase subunit gamma